MKYLSHKKIYKIWYQTTDKCGTHEHLGAITHINATF